MTIFERTKELAKSKGLNLRQLEEKAGLGTNSLYRWKTYNPRMESLKSVADVLGVSTDYLLGNTDETNKSAIPSDESLDKSLDRSIAYDGTEITDHDRTIIKAMLKAYFENKDNSNK
ncbi:helix-turn-helix transcriptional regulator [Weissella koreensis]|uniref:helix-turn-helix domain-containing protein n=1 Tax=Weissella koreensis TaxID=165096 RepID=UPI0022BA1366|nr:helix-turn-helix transcriptional regulator [Weissella koreensis]MCZ9311618.1 helix-turn-helix transcriptional regulator [Weissella koreensis]